MLKRKTLGWLGLAGLAMGTAFAGCSGGDQDSATPGGADVSVVRSSVAHDTAPSVTDAQYVTVSTIFA